MRKAFENPKMSFEMFDPNDVVATSGYGSKEFKIESKVNTDPLSCAYNVVALLKNCDRWVWTDNGMP